MPEIQNIPTKPDAPRLRVEGKAPRPTTARPRSSKALQKEIDERKLNTHPRTLLRKISNHRQKLTGKETQQVNESIADPQQTPESLIDKSVLDIDTMREEFGIERKFDFETRVKQLADQRKQVTDEVFKNMGGSETIQFPRELSLPEKVAFHTYSRLQFLDTWLRHEQPQLAINETIIQDAVNHVGENTDKLIILEEVVRGLNGERPRADRYKGDKIFQILKGQQMLNPLAELVRNGYDLSSAPPMYPTVIDSFFATEHSPVSVKKPDFTYIVPEAERITQALHTPQDREYIKLLIDAGVVQYGMFESLSAKGHAVGELISPDAQRLLGIWRELVLGTHADPTTQQKIFKEIFRMSPNFANGEIEAKRLMDQMMKFDNPEVRAFCEQSPYWSFLYNRMSLAGGDDMLLRNVVVSLHEPGAIEQYISNGKFTFEFYTQLDEMASKSQQPIHSRSALRKLIFDQPISSPSLCPPELDEIKNFYNGLKFHYKVLDNYVRVFDKYVLLESPRDLTTLTTDGKPNSNMILEFAASPYIEEHGSIALSTLFSDDHLVTLPPEEQKIWQVFRNLNATDRRDLASTIIQSGGIRSESVEKFQTLQSALDKINQSPSREVKRIKGPLLRVLFESDEIDQTVDAVLKVFERNNLPSVGKIFRVFEIIYPPQRIDERLSTTEAALSPVLKGAYPQNRYDIIYRDLLNIHIDSANPSLRAYLSDIKNFGAIAENLDSATITQLTPDETVQVEQFLNQMDVLYANSLYGKRAKGITPRNLPLDERVRKLKVQFGVREGQTLTDRVSEMFLRPIGLSTIDEALMRMDAQRTHAQRRNAVFAEKAQKQGGFVHFESGDLLKGIDHNYLGDSQRNGVVAREYLGAASGSDKTPFDTDVERLEPQPNTSFNEVLTGSIAERYGNLFFVIKDRGQFKETVRDESARYQPGKYELFNTGFHGKTHYGVRTGLPASGVDYMIMRDALRDNNHERNKIFFTIAQNGLYIPIVNEHGEVIFTPEDVSMYELDPESIQDAVRADDYSPAKLIAAFKENPYLQFVFEGSTGVSEEYSLEEHTEMVMRQFERYFADTWSSPLLEKEDMVLLLSLHDIGKPEAVKKTNSTAEQHSYTKNVLPDILSGLRINGPTADIITAIATQDILGEYMKSNDTPQSAAGRITAQARELGVSAQDLYKVLEIYYLCDASGYTTDADPQREGNLDHIFIIQRDPGAERGTIKFAKKQSERIHELKQSLGIG